MKNVEWVKLCPISKRMKLDNEDYSSLFKFEENLVYLNKSEVLRLPIEDKIKVQKLIEELSNRKVIFCSGDDLPNYRVSQGRVFYKGDAFKNINDCYDIDSIVLERSTPVIRLSSLDGRRKSLPLSETILIN